MNRINVLFVILQMEMGGAERLVYNLARKINRKVFNPSVAWFFGNRILKEFQDLDIPLYRVPKRHRIDFSAMDNLRRIIEEKKIDIVNAHHFMSMVYSFYACKIRNRARLIYTEHSEWEIQRISWKWKKIGHHLLNRAEACVGVSAPVSNRIKEQFKTGVAKTFTICNGIDLDAFSSDRDKTSFKRSIGLSPHDRVIAVVANFRRNKNHIFLLKAFSELLKDHTYIKLLLIGQGFKSDPESSEQELRDFVMKNNLKNDVLFLGYRPNIPDFLNITDIACLPSIMEGLPISLIEAMATGLPLVGTDAPGIREVITPNRNGFLVKPGDVKGLKQALSTLILQPAVRRSFADASRSMADDKYSLAQCVNRYEDLFCAVEKSTRKR